MKYKYISRNLTIQHKSSQYPILILSAVDTLHNSPEIVGTYSVQSIFPAAWKNTTTTKAYYSDAVSPICKFTVKQEPVQPWSESPVPQDYWTRPINSANRNWNILGGNWLGGAHEQPLGAAGGTSTRLVQGEGPESAHVLWSKPYYIGGYNGGRIQRDGLYDRALPRSQLVGNNP